ncbi:MAG: DUF1559 domain-containing protein [Pirellulales bacterium]
MARRNPRSAFTLVELLVVITIIGMLMAMALPATQSVLDQARRAGCATNLSSIAKAIKTYESTHRTLPPGAVTCMTGKQQHVFGGVRSGAICIGPTWSVSILDYIGETPMANGVKKCLNSNNKNELCGNVCESTAEERWGEVGLTTPKIYLCPGAPSIAEPLAGGSEKSWFLPSLAKGNYAANFGAGTFGDALITEEDARNPAVVTKKQKLQGPFRVEVVGRAGNISMQKLRGPTDERIRGAFKAGYGKGVTMQSIKDGDSKTMMISEVVGSDGAFDGRGCWTNGSMGASNFTAMNPPNADGTGGVDEWYDTLPLCQTGIDKSNSMHCNQDRSNPDRWQAAARSGHADGINVVFCDTSVKYVLNTVSLDRVWQRYATVRGGDSPED